MTTTTSPSTPSRMTCTGLALQGYGHLPADEQARLARALRLAPGACSLLALAATLTLSPWLFGLLALVGWAGAASPHGSVVDRLYNAVTRGPKLPPTPAPRRFSCGLGGTVAVAAGLALTAGWTGTAVFLGGFFVLASAAAATTTLCLGGWIYGRLRRA